MQKSTFIGIPSHNGLIHGDLMYSILDAQKAGKTAFCHKPGSLLAKNFNDLLCEAINRKEWTHFVLLHADIVPQPGWLEIMHNQMDESGAQILSAAVPIKTFKGLSSCALIQDGSTMPFKAKRLTLKEIQAKNTTFTDPDLVVNTGLMLIDLSSPWIRDVWFEINDKIIQTEEGTLRSTNMPEDWNYSLKAREKGAKIYATSAVKLYHVGQHAYDSMYTGGVETEEWKTS